MTEEGKTLYLTRRQWNARYDEDLPEEDRDESPIPEVPEAGQYLWDWYFDLDAKITRISDGVCERIPPSEWKAWAELTGNIVYPWEFDILAAMDRVYSDAVTAEIAAGRALKEKPVG